MSSLQRYKKAGGFFQLLSLIESFGTAKKEKFLEMIESENPFWANALREKMLTLDRMFTWPPEVVFEVFKRLPNKSMAHAIAALKDDQKSKLTALLSQSEMRRMDDIWKEGAPKPEEVTPIFVKVLEIARKMILENEIRAEKFDEKLIIPKDFEAHLEAKTAEMSTDSGVFEASAGKKENGSLAPSPSSSTATASASAPAAHAPSVSASAEVAQLQRSLMTINKENASLKAEVRILRDKLEQIRKIA